jgi:cytoskeletal protein RodZ
MSLINDALKRVSEAERGKPAQQQTDFATRSLQPAEYERRSSIALWIILPVLLAAVGVGGFLLAKQKQPAQPPSVVAPKAPPQAVAVKSVEEAPAVPQVRVATPLAEGKPASVAVPAVATPETPAAASTSASPVISTAADATPAPTAQAAPAPAQPAPAPATMFRLKGILFTKSPTALINDGSVQVGGEIDGAKVTKIDRTSVELDYQGKLTVLKLGAR